MVYINYNTLLAQLAIVKNSLFDTFLLLYDLRALFNASILIIIAITALGSSNFSLLRASLKI